MLEGLVLVRETDGVIVYTNSRLEKMLNYGPGELIGKNISTINAPAAGKSPDEVAREIQTALREHGNWSGEILNVKKDGSHIWCQTNVSALESSEYGPIWVATHEDITERKELEDSLRRRANTLHLLQETLLQITDERDLPQLLNRIVERAAALLDAPGGGLYLCDANTREVRCVVSYNTKVDAVGLVLKYGEGAAGVVAETGKPLIIDDYRTWPNRAIFYEKEKPFGAVLSAPLIRQGRVIGVIHVLRYDERQFTERDSDLLALFANHAAIATENVRLYAQLDEHANQLESIVTERTLKLAESETRYRRLFESSPISLWEEDFSEVKKYFDELGRRGITDLRGYLTEHPEDLDKCTKMVKVLDVNEATLNLYGAKTVKELLGELGRVLTHESQAEFRFREELVALCEGKTRFESEFDNQALTGETRHVNLILNVVPGYEETLGKVLVSVIDLTERKEMEQRLQQTERLAAVGETAAMVGHDLRNPLQAIAAAVHLLKKESLTTRERDEMLRIIERSLDYSDAIIRDLSDYSAEIQLRLEETTPKSVVRAALEAIKVPKNISVQDLSEDQPTLGVDSERLKRVFINLIENAIDAMPQGGTVTLTSKQHDSTVEICCSDTGSGMSGNVMDNLWKPLHTTKAKGLGLGLAICKRIVDAHEGEISVRSRAGTGTTVTICLPIKSEAEVRHQ
jgi:PAS domain S-box-containing protein